MIPFLKGFVFQETTEGFVFQCPTPVWNVLTKETLETVFTHSERIFTTTDYISSLLVEEYTKKNLKIYPKAMLKIRRQHI